MCSAGVHKCTCRYMGPWSKEETEKPEQELLSGELDSREDRDISSHLQPFEICVNSQLITRGLSFLYMCMHMHHYEKKMELKQSQCFLVCFLRALVQSSGPSVCAAIYWFLRAMPHPLPRAVVCLLPPAMLVSLGSSQGAYGPLLCNSRPIHRQAINLGNSSLYIWAAITNVLPGHIFTAWEDRDDDCCQGASWGSLITLSWERHHRMCGRKHSALCGFGVIRVLVI